MTQHHWFVNETANLKVDPAKLYSLGDNSNPDLVMAAISAKELIKLAGISDTTIFAQNVRLRVVKVGEDRSLAASIAYKTNNQNPISLRDLSANDSTQILIKSEFDRLYGFDSTYMIKQGAAPSSNELTNGYAGQLLLSL